MPKWEILRKIGSSAPGSNQIGRQEDELCLCGDLVRHWPNADYPPRAGRQTVLLCRRGLFAVGRMVAADGAFPGPSFFHGWMGWVFKIVLGISLVALCLIFLRQKKQSEPPDDRSLEASEEELEKDQPPEHSDPPPKE